MKLEADKAQIEAKYTKVMALGETPPYSGEIGEAVAAAIKSAGVAAARDAVPKFSFKSKDSIQDEATAASSYLGKEYTEGAKKAETYIKKGVTWTEFHIEL